MKVALISTPSTSGKTTIGFLLGCVWARIMKTKSYHMTTGSFDEYFNMLPDIDIKMRGHTRELRAALRAASIESAESFATSFTSQGNYPICEFSDPSSPEEKGDTLRGFATLLPPTGIILVEISNDANLEDNINVINSCDVALILCRPMQGEAARVRDTMHKYNITIPSFPLLMQVNNLTVTKKELDIWFAGMKYLTFSYSPAIQKFINKKKADALVNAIINVDFNTGTLRQELHNILAMLYAPVKIPEVNKWS